MDPNALAGMAFTLLLALMIGGFILLYPLSRRFAALMQSRMEERKTPPPSLSETEVAALRESIEQLATELRRLTDRQDFMEKLLSHRVEPRLVTATPPDDR